MITKIKKIENLGIFSGYPSGDDPECIFKKYNIIYGMNGTGKTTLSKLFEKVANKEKNSEADVRQIAKDDYPNANYMLETTRGELTPTSDTPLKVMVFNRDYIAKNIQFDNGGAEHILTIGESNIKAEQALKNDKQDLQQKIEARGALQVEISDLDKACEKKFMGIAKDIKEETNIPETRNYDKKKARVAFEDLKHKKLLNPDELKKHKDSLLKIDKDKQETVEELLNMKENTLVEILNEAKELCEKTASSKVIIDELKSDKEKSDWVEEGIGIHGISRDGKSEMSECLFCSNRLTEDGIRKLLDHFDEEKQNLIKDINSLANRIKILMDEIEGKEFPNKDSLYLEFKEEYSAKIERLQNSKIELKNWLVPIKKKLEYKEQNTEKPLILEENPLSSDLLDAITDINKIIDKHNDKFDNYSSARVESLNIVIDHYLSKIFDDVKENQSEIERLAKDLEGKDVEIEALGDKIKSEEKEILKAGPACEKINKYIGWFFSRSEIQFDISEDGKGYIIERGEGSEKGIATSLSEGEKTAIALIYFMIMVKNEKGRSVVVIDDPVSSLDSNFLYNAFSLLTTAKGKFYQLFILTHSFDFLKMLLNSWEENFEETSPDVDDKENDEVIYFMIKNKAVNKKRRAFIDNLDEMLRKFNSEYHYLFCMLYNFDIAEDPNLYAAYPMPNMIRKFLETFLEFQVPQKNSIRTRLFLLLRNNKKIISGEVDEIIKFVHEKSHSTSQIMDPNLVKLSQEATRRVLDIVKHENESHYCNMERQIRKIKS